MRLLALVALTACLVGCAQPADLDFHKSRPPSFGPASMRIHPVFTQVRDWSGDGKADGIEAFVEFQDEFGDPTKAAGKILFELFEWRRGFPDPRGKRVVNPWVGSLLTIEDQREHWNRTPRAYRFNLAIPNIDTSRAYVLTATFEREAGGRFFDRIMIEAPPELRAATTQPSHDEPRHRAPKR